MDKINQRAFLRKMLFDCSDLTAVMNVEDEVVRVDDARVLSDGVDAVDEPAAAVGGPQLRLLHQHVLPTEGDRLRDVVAERRSTSLIFDRVATYFYAP